MMSHTILTIEDEAAIRKSFVSFLEDYEYNILEAGDGAAGIDAIKTARPDLVLADLRMPKVDGLQVLEYVGTHHPEIPVIVVSGTGNISDVIDALHLGAWDYILKPVEDLNILLFAVRRALEKVRLAGENRRYRENLEEQVSEKTLALEKANAKLQSINRELRTSLEEKEVLLQEVHHRVKNNMQVIMSLMNLQKPVYRDKFDVRLIDKSIHRIQAMAMAHEQLYRTNDFTQINLKAYLKGMVDEIIRNKTAVGDNFDVKVESQEIYMGTEIAIPIGLIIHELADNAIEHAYPDGGGGETRISAVKNGSTYTIMVSDNGIGLPENIDIEKATSLGFMLVQTLTTQIEGKLTVQRQNGTIVNLEFEWQG
jgi:two-component sensor histidine kinase/CheY-like chemotaxis protein